jgi:hypothetical protein
MTSTSRLCKICGSPIELLVVRKRNVHCLPCSQTLNGAKNKKHGASETREYARWASMRERCNNPKAHNYHLYGGRGIRVCERWNSFENFIADMGLRPTNKHSIERIDNNGNYEPSNCKWATQFEQSQNRRNAYTPEQDQKIREAVAMGLNFRQMAEYVGKPRVSVMTRTYRKTLEREKDKLWVSDSEIIRRLGVPEKKAREAIRMAEAKANFPGSKNFGGIEGTGRRSGPISTICTASTLPQRRDRA